MKIKLDLHVHSAASPDGRMTVEEIVRIARARGLDGVAICDHDQVYQGPTEYDGFFLIPGVEFSTEFGHILGLFVDQPLCYTTLEATADAVHQMGGLFVLAHPFARTQSSDQFLPLLPFLEGIEIWNGRAERKNPWANTLADQFRQEHGLRAFGGSDAHLSEEIGNGVVSVNVPEKTLSGLRKGLAQGEVQVTGVRGRALCVARSQYTKLKKGRTTPYLWLKWVAFAAKCALEDGRERCHRKRGGTTCH